MHHEASLLTDTTVWYGFAVLIFVVAMFVGARKAIASLIDGAIAKVVAELEEAKRLRAEAAETLATYKAKQADALREAEEIVAKAKIDAARLQEETEAEMKAALERQEHTALERIRMVQEEAAIEVRRFVIDETMHELRGKLAKFRGSSEASGVIDQVIDGVSSLMKNKVA